MTGCATVICILSPLAGREGWKEEENEEEADGSSIVSQCEPIGLSLDPGTQEAFNSC